MGRLLIGAGIVCIVAGVVVILAERAGIHLGNLPGDIRISGKRGGFYFPVVTCLVLSAALSLIFWLIGKR